MDIWEIVLTVAVVGVIAWTIYQRATGRSATAPGGLVQELNEAMYAAREAVKAAEQLWVSGQITADERFDWVLSELQKLFPGLTREALKMTIEAAVFWLKTSGLSEQLREYTLRNLPNSAGSKEVSPGAGLVSGPVDVVLETEGPVLVVETDGPGAYRPDTL